MEGRLKETTLYIAYAWKSEKESPMQVDLPEDGSVSNSTGMVYLGRKEMEPKIRIEKIRGRNEYSIDPMRSPVVQYSRGYDDAFVIRPGRFYYIGGFYDDSGIWVEKDEDFKKWAEKILRMARTFFKKRRFGSFYLGENAAEALNAGAKLGQV